MMVRGSVWGMCWTTGLIHFRNRYNTQGLSCKQSRSVVDAADPFWLWRIVLACMLLTVVRNLGCHIEYVNSNLSPILTLVCSEPRDGQLVISYNISHADQKIERGIRLIEGFWFEWLTFNLRFCPLSKQRGACAAGWERFWTTKDV